MLTDCPIPIKFVIKYHAQEKRLSLFRCIRKLRNNSNPLVNEDRTPRVNHAMAT
jgi:hypothetical protein